MGACTFGPSQGCAIKSRTQASSGRRDAVNCDKEGRAASAALRRLFKALAMPGNSRASAASAATASINR
ncbi:hypothetical protein D3C87_2156660 [compost metagenome]